MYIDRSMSGDNWEDDSEGGSVSKTTPSDAASASASDASPGDSDADKLEDSLEQSVDAECVLLDAGGPAVPALANPFVSFQNGMAQSLAAFDALDGLDGENGSQASHTSSGADTRDTDTKAGVGSGGGGGGSGSGSGSGQGSGRRGQGRPQSGRPGVPSLGLGALGIDSPGKSTQPQLQLRGVASPSPLNVPFSEAVTPRLRPIQRSMSLNEDLSLSQGVPASLPNLSTNLKSMRTVSFDRIPLAATPRGGAAAAAVAGAGVGAPAGMGAPLDDVVRSGARPDFDEGSLASSQELSQRDDDSMTDGSVGLRFRSQSDLGYFNGIPASSPGGLGLSHPQGLRINIAPINTDLAAGSGGGVHEGGIPHIVESPSQRRQRVRMHQQQQQQLQLHQQQQEMGIGHHNMMVEGVPASPYGSTGSSSSSAMYAPVSPGMSPNGMSVMAGMTGMTGAGIGMRMGRGTSPTYPDRRPSWGPMRLEDPPGCHVGFGQAEDLGEDLGLDGGMVVGVGGMGVGGLGGLGMSLDHSYGEHLSMARSPIGVGGILGMDGPNAATTTNVSSANSQRLDQSRREIKTANRDRVRERSARRDLARRGVSALPREASLQGHSLSPGGVSSSSLSSRRAKSGGPMGRAGAGSGTGAGAGLAVQVSSSLSHLDISACNAVEVPMIVTSPVVRSGPRGGHFGGFPQRGEKDPSALARLQRGPFPASFSGGFDGGGGGGVGDCYQEGGGDGDGDVDGGSGVRGGGGGGAAHAGEPPLTPSFPVGESPEMLNEHEGAVTRMRCPGNSHLMLSASTDGTVRIWSAHSTESLAVLSVDSVTSGGAKMLASPPRHLSAKARLSGPGDGAGGYGGGGNAERPLSHRRIKVLHCWSDINCETVWGACSDGAVRVWNGAEGRPLRLLQGHEEGVTCIEGMEESEFGRGSSAFVQGSHDLIATGSTDKTVRMWDYRAKKALVHTFRGHSDSILALRWGDGGRSILSGSKDKTLKIWDTRAGRLRVSLDRHFGAVTTIRTIPEGAGVYGAQKTKASSGHVGEGPSVSDGASHISAGRDANLHFWTPSGRCVASLAAHRGGAACLSDVRMTPADSAYGGAPIVLSSGMDGIVKLWDLRRQKHLSDINCGSVTKVVWSGWGDSFVTAYGASGVVRLWQPKPVTAGGHGILPSESMDSLDSSGSLLGSLGGRGEWESHDLVSSDSPCTDIKSNGQQLAVSFKNGQILRWANHHN